MSLAHITKATFSAEEFRARVVKVAVSNREIHLDRLRGRQSSIAYIESVLKLSLMQLNPRLASFISLLRTNDNCH